MEIDNNVIERTAVARIAAEIVRGLDTAARDAILAKAVTEALGGYSLKTAVENAVRDKAAAVAVDMLATEEWSFRVAAQVRAGLSLYMEQLPVAVAKALRQALHGKNDPRGYGAAGLPLQTIRFPGEES